MDDILRYPHTAPAPAPAKVRSVPKTRAKSPALPRFRFGHRDAWERRSPADAAVFLVAAVAILVGVISWTMYGPSYEVTVDGESFGYVEDTREVEDAIGRVEARAAAILGHDYTLKQEIAYEYKLSLREDRADVAKLETYLFDEIGEVMKTSVLTVDGKMIGAADDAKALNDMLDSIKAPYINENTVSAQFLLPVEVTREYTPTSALRDLDDMKADLTYNVVEQVDYVVEAGDVFSIIANSNGMTVKELQALNPDVDVDHIHIGDVLMMCQSVPYLSVQTVDNVTYDGALAYDTEEVEDNSMYQGQRKVLTPGVEGWATFNADVTYINGVEQERTINSTEVHEEPVTQVVAVGTKARPKTMATGSFQWPIYGTVTSGYGNRYIFGSYSFHSGIDIAGSYGQSIAAADGGKVVFAGTGTGSYWSYGNYVVIDHENGLQTIYAHCSSLCVKAGDRVYKGQTIAKVGSTGRSTGNHCHFQVKVNGQTVNPWNYLP